MEARRVFRTHWIIGVAPILLKTLHPARRLVFFVFLCALLHACGSGDAARDNVVFDAPMSESLREQPSRLSQLVVPT